MLFEWGIPLVSINLLYNLHGTPFFSYGKEYKICISIVGKVQDMLYTITILPSCLHLLNMKSISLMAYYILHINRICLKPCLKQSSMQYLIQK